MKKKKKTGSCSCESKDMKKKRSKEVPDISWKQNFSQAMRLTNEARMDTVSAFYYFRNKINSKEPSDGGKASQ